MSMRPAPERKVKVKKAMKRKQIHYKLTTELLEALEDVLTTGNSDDFDWSGENTKASLLAACSAALAAAKQYPERRGQV